MTAKSCTENGQASDEDEAHTPPSAPVPPLQMQPSAAQVQAPLHHQQPTVVSNLAIDQVLALLSEAFVECEGLGLQAKRALACTCSTLRPVIFQLLRQPRLLVQESDAIWDNARFVAIVLVPNAPKQVLCVAGETCVPEMKLAHLRTLPKLKVGAMGPTAALFFGAAIAESDCVLRLSTGATKSLRALRENDRVNLQLSDISQPSDRNAMLGALTLNAEQHVTVTLCVRRPAHGGTTPTQEVLADVLLQHAIAPHLRDMAARVGDDTSVSVYHSALAAAEDAVRGQLGLPPRPRPWPASAE